MKKIKFPIQIIFLSIAILMVACDQSPKDFTLSDEAIEIYPDYTSIVIPPNFAPLNFKIMNEGDEFNVLISNSKGTSITISSSTGHVEIPEKAWKNLLNEDKGGTLTVEIFRKTADKKWEKFSNIVNHIATEEIDSYIAYRKIPLANIIWNKMGIYQRSLESFEVSPIMTNDVSDNNCMNCHKFSARNPKQMVFHMRSQYGGTFVLRDDVVRLIQTKSEHTRGNAAYSSWHPGGNIIAFSVNIITQGFHAQIGKISYVNDRFSDIIIYDVDENTITRPKELSTSTLENLPSWSPDGKTMYYVIADPLDETQEYSDKRYSLVSIGFDEETLKFSSPDTLLRADNFGHSITFPREAPGHGLIAFMSIDYGYFSITNKEADIYFYDPSTGETMKPTLNSDDTESAATWSSNGAWLMFISKREDGILSQVYFSHIDEKGNSSKPFVLPQKNPDFYDDYLFNYNLPEYISGKVELTPRKVFSVIKGGAQPSFFNEEGSVSLSSGATIMVEAPTEPDMYPKH